MSVPLQGAMEAPCREAKLGQRDIPTLSAKRQQSDDINMLIMREPDLKFGNEVLSLL
jgi:hypothetical protein